MNFPSLKGHGAIAFDCETCDPNIESMGPGYGRDGFIAGVSVATEKGFAAYYPVAHEAGGNLPKDKVFRWLKEQMALPVPKIGANLLYDIGYLDAEGIKVNGPLYDIMIAEPLLNENRFSYGLDVIGKARVDKGKNEDELYEYVRDKLGIRKKSGWKGHIWRVPPEIAAPYAITDVTLPIEVFDVQKKELEKQNLWDLFLMESKLIPMLLAMRKRGVAVDLDYAERMLKELEARKQQEMNEIWKLAKSEISIWSADELAILFDAQNVAYTLTAKTKKPSFTAQWLERCEHPIAQRIVAARKMDKLCSVFLRGAILEGHWKGRVHCSFNQLRGEGGGTVSGRFSSSQPNLQQIPAHSEDGKRIRSIFIPDEGQEWWAYDYCVAPDAVILTTDLRHVPAKDITPGTEVVGFDEHVKEGVGKGSANKHRRKLRRTKVLYTKRLMQPCYRIITDRGEVIVSEKHRWLAKDRYSASYDWRTTESLKIGSMIPRLVHVWQDPTSYEDGWMGGFMDGEGWYSNTTLGVGQNEGPLLNRARSWLSKNGFVWDEQTNPVSRKSLIQLRIVGGRAETWRMLGMCRPERIIRTVRENYIDTYTLQSSCMKYDTVQKIEFVGVREVIAVQTECNTLIVNGLASHNSQIEYRLMVHDAVMYRLKGAQDVADQYAKDPNTDFHQVVADMAGIPRKSAKTVNFGIAYGEGVLKLIKALNLTQEEGEEFMRKYHRNAPFMKPLANGYMQMAASEGEVRTLMNRKRRFDTWEITKRENGERKQVFLPHRVPGAKRAFTYAALNARIQGSAADIMKKAMVDIWESGVCDVLGVPQLTVHDELDGSKPKTKKGNEAYREVGRIMQNVIPLNIPLLVDGGTGPNWGEAK